jgi:hypothetical protein
VIIGGGINLLGDGLIFCRTDIHWNVKLKIKRRDGKFSVIYGCRPGNNLPAGTYTCVALWGSATESNEKE